MTDREMKKRERFNCMGYALGVERWIHPNEFDFWGTVVLTPEKFPKLCRDLEKDYGLVRIAYPKDAPREVEVIAFRIAPKFDFHFMVRKHGTWFEKRGITPRLHRRKKSEVEDETLKWNDRYSGEIAYFIK